MSLEYISRAFLLIKKSKGTMDGNRKKGEINRFFLKWREQYGALEKMNEQENMWWGNEGRRIRIYLNLLRYLGEK